MPRPCKQRNCKCFEGSRVFKPRGIPMSKMDTTTLELGELEVMRLCDVENLNQTEAGEVIGLSRGSVQRLLASGRAKVVTALLNSSALVIKPGQNDSEI